MLQGPSGSEEEDDKVKIYDDYDNRLLYFVGSDELKLSWLFMNVNLRKQTLKFFQLLSTEKFMKYKKKEIATMTSGQPFLINPHTLCQALCKSKCILNMLIFQRLSLIGDDAMWIVQSNLD